MGGERLEAATIAPEGLEGDRRWGVFKLDTGKVLSAKSEGRLLEARATLAGDTSAPVVTLPDRQELEAGDKALDQALTEWLGYEVALRGASADGTPWEFMMSELYPADMEEDGVEESLVELDTPGGSLYDLAAAHLLTTASIEAAADEHPTGEWDVRRFRPQILIDTGDATGFVENNWVGQRVRAGEAEFTGFMPTVRCVVPTRPQPGLERDLGIWKTLKRANGFNLGLYANITGPGAVEVGDPVKIQEPAPSSS